MSKKLTTPENRTCRVCDAPFLATYGHWCCRLCRRTPRKERLRTGDPSREARVAALMRKWGSGQRELFPLRVSEVYGEGVKT